MATFSISQHNPNDAKLVIYPNSDISGCTAWTANGASPNYACIDEDKHSPDYGTTYVSTASSTITMDIYGLPSQSDLGYINNIRVFATVRSATPPGTGAEFYLVSSPTSQCTDVYLSSNKDLVTAWRKHSHTFEYNPWRAKNLPIGGDPAWVWADFATLAIGIQGKSGAVPTSTELNLTINPSADGDTIELSKSVSCNNNYECVTQNNNIVYNPWQDGADHRYDLYELDNHTTETGVITGVTVYASCNPYDASGSNRNARVMIKTGGSEYQSNWKSLSYDSWTLISKTWDENPNTSAAWTWGDIDALQAGVRLDYDPDVSLACRRVYVVVTYLANEYPDIEVTQCYAEVDYTPSSATCYLQKPIEISTNHDRNIKMFNFWNGEREVYDYNRSGKSMTLVGYSYSESGCTNSACSEIICIRTLARNGAVVTIDGLSPNYFNGNFRIIKFGWRKISMKPEHFTWILELEDDEK